MTILGTHVVSGSRNGYNGKLHRGVVSYEHGAISGTEVKPDCFTVWRNIDQYGQGNADNPPGFEQFTEAMARANAKMWWDTSLRTAWNAHPADAYQLTNEVGGSDPRMLRLLVAFEDELMELNKAAGNPYTFLVGSCAGDSPGWETDTWQTILAPHIIKAWSYGHIYGRHAYTGVNPNSPNVMMLNGLPADANVNRPFTEIDWFRANHGLCGPIIISECGYVTYPGDADLYVAQMAEYAEYAAANYPEIGFIALFTYGKWWHANIEQASDVLNAYLASHPYTEWIPNGDYDMELEARVTVLEQQVAALTLRVEALEGGEPPPIPTITEYRFTHGDVIVDLNAGQAAVNYQA